MSAVSDVVAAEFLRGPGDVAGVDAARRRRGARDHDVELVGAQRGEHLGRIAQRADHQDPPPVGMEVLEEHLRRTLSAPAGLWAPSTMTSGCCAEHLEAAGHRRRWRTPSSTTSVAERRGEERLDRGERDGRVVALVRAVQREEDVGVDRRRGAQIEQPPPDGERVVDASRSRSPRTNDDAPPARSKIVDQLRSVSPITAALPGLMMPAFSAGDVGQRRAGELGVVHADVGDDRDLRVDDVGGVPPAEQADLDHGDVDGDVGEPAERGGRDRLEVGRADTDRHFEVGDRRRSARRSRRR